RGVTAVRGVRLNLNRDAYGVLLAPMWAGTPAVSFLGAVGAALTVATRRGGLLLGLLLLPLFVPTLIFGIEAIGAALTGADSFRASFLILTAISLAAVVLAPVAAAGALRFQLQ